MACAAPLVAATTPRELRKTVTALFCDVVGSTALGDSSDPEAVRAVLARYFDRMKGIVERHGGTVEKFIGDAVVAVFGVPVVHEDDALRACRAAVEMRDALPEIGLQCRIGVNTGEVVTTTDALLASGDAMNVAARLEQVAEPGQILLGQRTLALVRSAVEVEPVAPLELKGKAEPVLAFRLLAVTGELERRFATPMVGREHELARLRAVFGQAVHDRSCQLFTVLGSAGVGKSRLAAELLARLEARVVRGRCLSYGDGITYWPVVEVLKQLGSFPEGDSARPLRALLGDSDDPASAEEIAWGFRKLLEQEAQREPLICVLDDLHWGEETLLDLVEHVADLSRDAPILLLCMARPELLERRPSWGGGKWNATSVLLEPLDAAETERLIGELGWVPEELRARIIQTAEGNPLFLEEMLALVRNSSGGEVEVPPTIQALLAARLDQLDPAERAVLERGSVEGRVFHRGAVSALADGDGQIDTQLLALVRKELVRPDRPQLPLEDAYRFRHLLIRDAAYDSLPKGLRADLHRRFAAWLEVHGGGLVELEEILGYHLEQAARCLADLGRPDPELAAEAAARLSLAGRRARHRLDAVAARSFFQRAVALGDGHDVHIVVDLARALETPLEGASLLDEAADRAESEGDRPGAALARAVAAYCRMWTVKNSGQEQERLALEALPLLEAAGDHLGLAEVWNNLAQGVYNSRCQYAQIEYASEQARQHAMLAGQQPRGSMMSVALMWGPRPAAEALQIFEASVETEPHLGQRLDRAIFLAMGDRIEEARALAQAAEHQLREFGGERMADIHVADLERIAGDHRVEAQRLRMFCDDARKRDVRAALSTYASMLGRALCAAGEFNEVEGLAAEGREYGDEDDPITQALWRQATALVQSHRGNHAEAERLCREAVVRTRMTDSPWVQGDALCDLATVLEATGRRDEAAGALHEALACYERKGIIPLVRRTRERLAALEEVSDTSEGV